MNSKSQLNKAISIEINKFIKENQSYFDSFEKKYVNNIGFIAEIK